ncbi:MAG: putative LPS assembly protein LptD [Bacteroidia bacterium]
MQTVARPFYSKDKEKTDTNHVAEADNSLKSKVHYSAKDSIILALDSQKVYLYGDAVVDYESTTIHAAYMEVNFKTHIIVAEGKMDSNRVLVGKPVVKEGAKSFTARKIKYNTETKKGKIYEITTQEGDGKILGEAVKKDSTSTYFISDGRYSTCVLDDPHFAIHAKKLKVIADDKIITGPATLQVMGINTPLTVPFVFFPNKRGRSSGIILPTYGESVTQGFYLQNGGYYFGLSDKFDLALKGDIYSHGSYQLKTESNYRVRYQYSGMVGLIYARNIIQTGTTYNINEDDYHINWTHTQDPLANPSIRFTASVNAGTSNYNSINAIRPAEYLANTLQSNISWSKNFLGTPFSISANLRHTQNSHNHTVDLSLPDIVLTMNRINPFKSNNTIGEKWYDKIGLSATVDLRNDYHSGDSTFLKGAFEKKLQNGIHTVIPITTTLRSHLHTRSRILNSLNYISLNPNLTITDNLYSTAINKKYALIKDSAIVKTDTSLALKNEVDYVFSAGLTTKFYGRFLFKHGNVKAIQHIITPTVSFVYRPDFSENKYGYYKNVQTNTAGQYSTYSVFPSSLFGLPPSGLQEAVAFGLTNSLEAKLKARSDTAKDPFRYASILDNVAINSSYNAAAPHFKWSVISINASTILFKKINNPVTIAGTTTLDPYLMGADGADIEKFEINHNDRIARLTNANMSVGTSFKSRKKPEPVKKTDKGSREERENILKHPEDYVDFNLKWTLNIQYSINYSRTGRPDPTYPVFIADYYTKPVITDVITQTIRFTGDFNLTPKWKIGFNTGYDLVKQSIAYTNINVHRDLHCWDMSFNWIPIGPRQSYSLDLKVKSALLQDLKLSRKKEWYDYTN